MSVKMIKKNQILMIVVLITCIFMINLISAQDFSILDEENVSMDIKAKTCLKEINLTIQMLDEDNFSTERIIDLLEQSDAFYFSQIRKIKPNQDFSNVIKNCEEVGVLYELAYSSMDEFKAVVKFYNETLSSDINTSEIDVLISEIQKEIDAERYELVGGLVDITYDKIIEVKASYGALEIIKRQTASFFIKLFTRNLEIKIPIILILVLFYILFKKRIQSKYIRHKIEMLSIRRGTLKNLIKKMQRHYFQENKISESDYVIKTKKFAELIRDIDKQTPLLQEELFKLSKKPSMEFIKLQNEKKPR